MMKVLIRNAHVLTMDDEGTEHPTADVWIENGRIEAIGPDLGASQGNGDARVINGTGKLVMPGLINAHFHSPGNLMKGAFDGHPLEIFMLYEVPPLQRTPPPPRANYVRTMIGAMEMLKTGITSVQDDAFHVPVPTPDGIDAIMNAYVDSGMRARVSLDQGNVVEYERYPFLAELLPADLRHEMERVPRQSTAELVDLYRWFVERWNGAASGRIGTAVSCSAPQRVTPDLLMALHELGREHDLPYFIHVLETKLQCVLGQEKHGKSFIRYLHDHGVLDERCNIIHAIWIDGWDIDLLADSGCVVAHNPLCNLKLGSGVMPFRPLRDRGIPICLGSDEAISDDAINMWSVAKFAGLIHRLAEPDYQRWPTAREILHCLIRGGAAAMLASDRVGVLAPGYQADLIMLDKGSLSFTPLNDVHRQLVFCENGSSVEMTMVAGEILYENGELKTIDEGAIKEEARQIAADLHEGWGGGQDAIDRLEPYYREMYLRALRSDVGMDRKLSSFDGQP